jgi:hypothetical protein
MATPWRSRLCCVTSDPSAKKMIEMLLAPPAPAEVVEHAETREFAG